MAKRISHSVDREAFNQPAECIGTAYDPAMRATTDKMPFARRSGVWAAVTVPHVLREGRGGSLNGCMRIISALPEFSNTRRHYLADSVATEHGKGAFRCTG